MKAIYISTIVAILLVAFGVPIYFKYFNKPPSCFDGKQNQDELGIDCGGTCALLCPEQSRDPLISFQRLYEANRGVYTALAMLENPNQGVFARKVSYSFKVYDVNNVLLQEVTGSTFIPPAREFPVFASPIVTNNRVAVKETFAITDSSIAWEQGAWVEPALDVANVNRSQVNGRERVEADIVNHEVYPIKNLQVVAVVYDEDGNASEASATVLDYVSPQDTGHISFAWSKAFDFLVSKIDVIPRPLPRDKAN